MPPTPDPRHPLGTPKVWSETASGWPKSPLQRCLPGARGRPSSQQWSREPWVSSLHYFNLVIHKGKKKFHVGPDMKLFVWLTLLVSF